MRHMYAPTPIPSNQANFEMFGVKDLDTFIVCSNIRQMYNMAMERDFVSLSVESPIMENKKGHTTAL